MRCQSIVALLTLSLLAGAAQAAPTAFHGPYLNNVHSDGVTILWESPTPTTGVVWYGLNGPNEQMQASSAPSLHHEVQLIGLSGMAPPGTLFVYELEVGGQRYPGQFRTAVQGDTAFQFIAYGDNRSSEPQHTAVVDALMLEMPDAHFVMSTGDMVSDGENEGNWDTFFGIEAPFLARTPIYLAIGNHEVDDGDWSIGQRVFAPPTNVTPASNNEAFYHFIHGNTQLIVINLETDTLYTGLLSVLGGDQEDWLQDVLTMRPPGVRHRILFIHKGPYSSKPGRTGNFWLRQWMEDFKTHEIDLIISGHDHYAERGWTENGIPYVIHGGGGAPLYNTLGPRVVADHSIVYGASQLGYLVVRVDGPKLDVKIKDLNGHVVDTFSYGDTQTPQCMSVTDCGAPPQFGCLGGSWECRRSACNWTCGAGGGAVTCSRDSDCVTALGPRCSGTAVCERPVLDPRQWYCQCEVPPECTMASDCAGRPPPIPDCVGTWDCPDEVCEFSPKTLCEEDAGVPLDAAVPADAGDAEDAGISTDVGGQRDASPEDAARTEDAQVAPDSGPAPVLDAGMIVVDAGEVAAPVEEGCGCSSAGTARGPGLIWALLLGAVLARRRRRFVG